MFDLIEKEAALDTSNLDIWLKRTSRDIETQLLKKPILIFTYRKVPLLCADKVLNAICENLETKFHDVVSGLTNLPYHPQTLFIIQVNKSAQTVSIWSGVAKRLIESRGQCKFIILISEDEFEGLNRTSINLLLKPYYNRITSISESPQALMEGITGLKSLPSYKQRQLPELLFFAAACKLENEGLGEEDLLNMLSFLEPIEYGGQTMCYFPWRSLPKFEKIRNIYLDSIGVNFEQREIARCDQDFYQAVCFKNFQQAGNSFYPAEAENKLSSGQGDIFSRIVALQRRQKISQSFAIALSFLFRLGIVYTLARETLPTQTIQIGITENSYANQPSLKTDLQWVHRNVFPLGNAVDKGEWENFDWSKTGELIQPYIFYIASTVNFELSSTLNIINDIVKEYCNRIKEYSIQECKNLFQKTLKTAYYIECSAKLSNNKIPTKLTGRLNELFFMCLEMIPKESVFNDHELKQIMSTLTLLCTLNPKYQNTKINIGQNQVINHVYTNVRENLEAADRIEHFFTIYAKYLRDHDFFLDKTIAKKLTPELAKLYIELDTRLFNIEHPFSADFHNNKDSTSLITSLLDADFDRVFVLIIDAFSYLDWKIGSEYYYSEIFDIDPSIQIKEDYRLSPIPTYTPCALTALLTGYHPSLTGICHWKLKTDNNGLIDLTVDSPSLLELENISMTLPKINEISLIHSQGATALTLLQESLANINSIPLPSSEHEKAITQASELISATEFKTKLVAIYIADFDEFGHIYLRENGFREYYAVQSNRIINELIKPIFRRAQKKLEKTLVVLTADHGKLTRYESRILTGILTPTTDFKTIYSQLQKFDHARSPRFIICWIPDDEINDVYNDLQSSVNEASDISILSDQALKRIFPYETQTQFRNPNLVVFSRFGTGGQAIAHGGPSLSEVVIPAISFAMKGE